MKSNSRSCRNAQQVSTRSNQPKKASVETIPTLKTASTLSQVPVSVFVLALYTKEDQ